MNRFEKYLAWPHDMMKRIHWKVAVGSVIAFALLLQLFTPWRAYLDWPPWALILVTLVMVQTTIAGVTLYLHRQMAHCAIVLHPIVEYFFRFWLWLTTGMITLEWMVVHRLHHVHVETEKDPHSPKIYGPRKVLSEGTDLYVSAAKRAIHSDESPEIIRKHGRDAPNDWIERHLYTPHEKFGVALMLVINCLLFGPLAGTLMWLTQIAWIPFWAAGVINGLGHFYGYRNFPSKNEKTGEEDWSKNIVPWAFWIGGEELHNNHHNFPQSAKFSARPFEFDIGWLYLRILETFHLVRIKDAYGKKRWYGEGEKREFRLHYRDT